VFTIEDGQCREGTQHSHFQMEDQSAPARSDHTFEAPCNTNPIGFSCVGKGKDGGGSERPEGISRDRLTGGKDQTHHRKQPHPFVGLSIKN